MTNPDNVGGLLPCPGCGKSDLDHCPADFVAVNGLTRGMIVRCAWCHFAAPEAAWNRRELCRAAPAGGDGDLWQPTPCPTCNGFCGDSGPTCAENNIAVPSAGSGEVERLAMAVEDAANVFSKSCDLHHELIEAAALLRKLQQGAE